MLYITNLCNRKISTYINSLIKAGFEIEQVVEDSDEEAKNIEIPNTDRLKKAKVLPLSFIIKAKKK